MAMGQKPGRCEAQNSWDLWMFIPLELIIIGFDPPPYMCVYLQMFLDKY